MPLVPNYLQASAGSLKVNKSRIPGRCSIWKEQVSAGSLTADKSCIPGLCHIWKEQVLAEYFVLTNSAYLGDALSGKSKSWLDFYTFEDQLFGNQ